MFSLDSQPLEGHRSREVQTHAQYLLLALSRAAQAIQRAHTLEDFYHAVGREIQLLGGNVALLMLNEDKQSLSIAYISYAPELIRKAEQMTGLSLRTYQLPILSDGVYERTIQGRKAIFIDSSIDTLKEVLPKPIQALSSPLTTVFNLRQGVLVPLLVDDEVLGLLKVIGPFLRQDDLSAMEAFAGQVAAGLRNVWLVQRLQDELTAHRKTELSLNHNRDLLLALSRASHAIQLVREPEDIYQVVGEQIRALGFEATILKFGSDKKSLHFRYTTISEKVIHAAEQLAGMKAEGFGWAISQDSIYARILANRRAEYISNGKYLFIEVLPDFLRPLAEKLSDLLSSQEGILAPLHVDNEAFGLLLVFGNSLLSEEDLPAVESFSAQVSVSLQNAHLTHRLQKELHERKQAEIAAKEAEKTLLISQSTFEGIFNKVTETIYIQDENGVFLDVNEGAEKMYGYPREHFIGRTPEFLSAPGRNDLARIAEYVQQAFDGQHVEFEFWGVKKDGSVFPKDVRLNAGMYFDKKVVIAVARDITERKRAEEALRSSEAKVHALLDAVPDILFVMTRDGEYVDYYTSHHDELLVSPADFLGKNIRDVMPQEISDTYFATQERLLLSGESQLFEYSLALPDGIHEFETHVDLYHDEYILCVARDVTERKRAEKAVRQAERRSKAMIENAPDGVSLIGMDGKIKYASPSAVKMFGYNDDDYVEENPVDSIHPEDVGSVIGVLAELVNDPAFVPTIQYRYKHQDGSYHWVESTFSNQFAEPGVEAIVINFRDITERKQMEVALFESERYYRALIENATDGIMVIDQEGKISYESPAVTHLLGYLPGELIGRNAFELINPDDLAQLFEIFTVGLAHQGYVHKGEYRLLHNNGAWRYFEIVSHYLMDDPAIMGIIINGRDITKRRQAEEALRESESRFHSFVSESTDGISLTDEEGRVIEFNDALEKITGLKREAVLGTFAWDFQIQTAPREYRTAELYQRIKDGIQDWLRSGHDPFDHPSVEIPIERADGVLRFIQIRKFSIRTEKGWRLGSLSHDITEKKQAEQALQQQFMKLQSLYQMTATLGQTATLEEVFEAALDSLQETLSTDRAAVLLFDLDGVIRFKSWRGLSEAYRKIAEGHSPWKQDALDPQPVLVPDVFADADLSHLRTAFESEGIGSLGFIPLVHQGKLFGKFMVYFNTLHIFNEEEVQLIQTIARHVAFAIFRQQAENALRASEEMYRILYEDNPSMYFTADENGRVMSVNKYGISQLGFAPEELVGKPIVDIFHPEDREHVCEQIETCLKNPEHTIQIEARKLHKNGKVMWIREAACAVHNSLGQLIILVTCDDITSRKLAEDELRLANRSLELAHRELQLMFSQEQVLARTDSLTGLYNRRHFFELAIREFQIATRYQQSLTVILFDVDDFKKANDTFGHAFGDEILSQISKTVSFQMREVDVFARSGGDEFIVLLPQTNAEQAFNIAERIRLSISQRKILAGGASVNITISIGVAEMQHDPDDHSIEDIISRADKALYQSKQRGRNHTVVFSES